MQDQSSLSSSRDDHVDDLLDDSEESWTRLPDGLWSSVCPEEANYLFGPSNPSELAFSAGIHFLRDRMGDVPFSSDPDEYCANYEDALRAFVEEVVGPDDPEAVRDGISLAEAYANAAIAIGFQDGGGREELEMAADFHAAHPYPEVVMALGRLKARQPVPPQRIRVLPQMLNRRRESRCSQPGRRRGSRRVSSRSAGGGGPGESDEAEGDPEALKLWDSRWGRVSAGLYRLLLREAAA
jgi:hypothetical protein